jgi:release factor glutamine methyltransferase
MSPPPSASAGRHARGDDDRRKTRAGSDTNEAMEVVFRGVRLRAEPGRVMTPRVASEGLVDTAVEIVGDRPARVADVGTGSGAIAVALAVALPQAAVFATDTSPAAVVLARSNVARLGLGTRVSVYRGDLLEPIPGPLDLVAANLPYLPAGDDWRYRELDGEPADAVFAAGDGLGPYRRLVEACRERLCDDGSLVIQFRRRVIVAARDELDALAEALSPAGGGAA